MDNCYCKFHVVPITSKNESTRSKKTYVLSNGTAAIKMTLFSDFLFHAKCIEDSSK